ncbi:hypothetical protein CFP56_036584 [Quercus suber]|uniref:Uncharacterized protein n=1 Tax=Quercus suber TaxID=58331 RepID=A0AAW0J840_QUESU
MFILLYLLSIIVIGPTSGYSHMVDSKVLNVGEELWKETLPLQTGLRLYQLQGLKPYTWYEVKISYPASSSLSQHSLYRNVLILVQLQIPASFSIQLKRDDSDLTLNHNRRLLNTEKLIFKTESLDSLSNQGHISVLVTVVPEGVVAIPHVQERQSIIFNIAWWVVVLVLLCLGLAFIIPSFLPSYMLQKSQSPRSVNHNVSKVS